MQEQNTIIWSEGPYSINRHYWEHVQQKMQQPNNPTHKKIELKRRRRNDVNT